MYVLPVHAQWLFRSPVICIDGANPAKLGRTPKARCNSRAFCRAPFSYSGDLPFLGLAGLFQLFHCAYGVVMKNRLRVLSFACAMLGVSSAQLASAGSELITDGVSELRPADLAVEVLAMPASVRALVLDDPRHMGRLAESMMRERRIEAEARASEVHLRPEVKARIEKAARDAVVEGYLEREYKKLEMNMPDFVPLARERYEVNTARFASKEAIRVAHILLKVDVENKESNEASVREKAQNLLAKVKGGADFSIVAEEASEDRASAKSGGALPGWIERGSLVPPFEEAAYALKPGELSGIVRTRFGYHIIKLIDYRPSTTRPFDEVKATLIEELRADELKRRKAALLARFDGKIPVSIGGNMLDEIRKAFDQSADHPRP